MSPCAPAKPASNTAVGGIGRRSAAAVVLLACLVPCTAQAKRRGGRRSSWGRSSGGFSGGNRSDNSGGNHSNNSGSGGTGGSVGNASPAPGGAGPSAPFDWGPIKQAGATAAKYLLGIPAALFSCTVVWAAASEKVGGWTGFGLAALTGTAIVRYFYLDLGALDFAHPLLLVAALVACFALDVGLKGRRRHRAAEADSARVAQAGIEAKSKAAMAALAPCKSCGVPIMSSEDRCPACGAAAGRRAARFNASPG